MVSRGRRGVLAVVREAKQEAGDLEVGGPPYTCLEPTNLVRRECPNCSHPLDDLRPIELSMSKHRPLTAEACYLVPVCLVMGNYVLSAR